MSGSTASPSVSTQPSAMCVAPITYERSTTSSSASPGVDAHGRRASMRPVASSTSTRAPASAPSADRARVSSRTARAARVDERRRGRRRRRRARPRRARCARPGPAARSGSTTGGPGAVDDLPARVDLERVRRLVRRRGEQRAAADLDAAVAQHARSRRSAAASDRAARRPPGRRPPAPDRSSAVGELAAPRPAPASPTLPPNAPPFASGRRAARRPARTSWRRVRGRRARPSSSRAAHRRRARRAAASGGAIGHRRAPALHLAGAGRGRRASDVADDPVEPGGARRVSASEPGGPGPRRRRRRARVVVGEPGVALRHRRPDPLRGAALELRPSPRRVQISATPADFVSTSVPPSGRGSTQSRESGGEVEGLVDGLPAGAAAEVRGEGAVDVGATRSCPSPRARRGAR